MKDQHTMIKGYRDLSQGEIDLINEIKAKGAELGEIIAKMQKMQTDESNLVDGVMSETLVEEFIEARRWTAIGKTDIQMGLMALTRAVARPNFF